MISQMNNKRYSKPAVVLCERCGVVVPEGATLCKDCSNDIMRVTAVSGNRVKKSRKEKYIPKTISKKTRKKDSVRKKVRI